MTDIQIDDGNVQLKVTKIENKKIYAKVLEGKQILPGKSINAPWYPVIQSTNNQD